jgi:hypothetical protein
MGKIDAPYLVTLVNKDGTERHYFTPRQADRQHGWATVRLHDDRGRPIRDRLRAAEACKPVAAIYKAWRAGEPGVGPHLIDQLGRVVKAPEILPTKDAPRVYGPGQIGAMVADFLAHDIFKELGEKTQYEYRTYLNLFVEKFGTTNWKKLAPGPVRTWLQERAADGGPSGAHALYRTARAFSARSASATRRSITPASWPRTPTRSSVSISVCRYRPSWCGRAPPWRPSCSSPTPRASPRSATPW